MTALTAGDLDRSEIRDVQGIVASVPILISAPTSGRPRSPCAVLPVVLPQSAIAAHTVALGSGELEFAIGLEKQQVVSPDGAFFSFEVPETERARLLNGLDQIGATLLREHAISNYQERDRLRRPWVYAVPFTV